MGIIKSGGQTQPNLSSSGHLPTAPLMLQNHEPSQHSNQQQKQPTFHSALSVFIKLIISRHDSDK